MSATKAAPSPSQGYIAGLAQLETAAVNHDDDLPKNPPRPHWAVVIGMVLLFLALLAALYVVGYLPHERALRAAQAAAELASHDSDLVAVIHPRPAAGASEVVLPCDIRPDQDTLIFPRASGYLKTLNVDIHDRVHKDQVLAVIEAPEIDAQYVQSNAFVAQAQANQAKAQADLELTQRSLDRYQGIGSPDVAKQELDERIAARDQARAALAQTKANVQAAIADLRRLEVLQGFQKIVAPFDGTITQRNYDVGALLSPGAGREMFRLQQSDKVRVFVNVPQTYATEIHIGQKATLRVRNYPRKLFAGTVARSADSLNAGTRTMQFELSFANGDGALVPGMYGEAHLDLASTPQALLVPVSALLFNAQGTQVATVAAGKVHFTSVMIGRDLGTELEVLDGLAPDAQVIINPSERIIEGGAVEVAQPAGAAAKDLASH